MPTENSELELEPEVSPEEREAQRNQMLCEFRATIQPHCERVADQLVEAMARLERKQRIKDTIAVVGGTLLVAAALTWTLLRMS